MDPHLFYVAPGSYRSRFVAEEDPDLGPRFNRWQVYNWDRKGILDQRRKDVIVGRYDGEVGWTSSEVGRLVAHLDAMGAPTW